MKTISFDLDDTLIPGTKVFETEPQNWFQRLNKTEKIRLGTIQLFKQLRRRNFRIVIYTTSFRSVFSIRYTFLTYGIWLDEIINQSKHNNLLKERKYVCTKLPSAFGIDIHVDDSDGVKMEGEKFNFKTIIIAEKETNWATKILNEISQANP
ncbi:MAG: HAD family hydrolase [Sphingobacteriales bacterium]|nr:MAG: HAD family hydrolase [Sphingobacteriales bacterium]